MISQEMRKFLAGINAQGAQKTASKGKMSTAEERANLDAFMAPLKIPGQIILEDFVLAGRPARKCAPPTLRAIGTPSHPLEEEIALVRIVAPYFSNMNSGVLQVSTVSRSQPSE